MRELYLGLISGTSVDGVDAALAEIGDSECRIVAAATTEYPAALLARVQRLIESPETPLAELGALDVAIGRFFADCALALLAQAQVRAADVAAIGSHGQTVYHEPAGPEPFTLQLGDPNAIAARTGIATVADFRGLDMALGGQGAPLVPAFHAWRFASPAETRVIVNIGGIANVTVLEPDRPVRGFDTGPGNTLLDLWARERRKTRYDDGGRWAASGTVNADLLARFLAEPFFAAAAPKSTGRELFNRAWLARHLEAHGALADADVQATLAELTAVTVARAIAAETRACDRVIVCGGGVHNPHVLARLGAHTGVAVESTERYGVPPDFVEASAFAWLAMARLRGRFGNVPSVTGARRAAVLGGVYCGSPA